MILFNKKVKTFLLSDITGGKNFYYTNVELGKINNFRIYTTGNFDIPLNSQMDLGLKVSFEKQDFKYPDYNWSITSGGFGINLNLKLSKKTAPINDVNYSINAISDNPNINQFLWNIHISHRMLSKDQFEVNGSWAYEQNVELVFSRPGKPTDNAYIESFNGSFPDECLNTNWFLSLEDATQKIENWKEEYNTFRPHSCLGDLTPEMFIENQVKTANFSTLQYS